MATKERERDALLLGGIARCYAIAASPWRGPLRRFRQQRDHAAWRQPAAGVEEGIGSGNCVRSEVTEGGTRLRVCGLFDCGGKVTVIEVLCNRDIRSETISVGEAQS